jgi:hypothetical protein
MKARLIEQTRIAFSVDWRLGISVERWKVFVVGPISAEALKKLYELLNEKRVVKFAVKTLNFPLESSNKQKLMGNSSSLPCYSSQRRFKIQNLFLPKPMKRKESITGKMLFHFENIGEAKHVNFYE